MEDAAYFQKHADRLKNTILSLMWDENDRFFYDIDKRTGEKLWVHSPHFGQM
jgi:neutral trehalase